MAEETVTRKRRKDFRDLSGRTFGRLTVIAYTERRYQASIVWHCRCSCGVDTFVPSPRLINGHTKSCGCLNHEAQRTHSGTGTREHQVWASMVARCRTPTHHAFARYGGRGIAVCERWLKFENFIADMGLRPPGRLTLERLDNDKSYGPENCKWATWAEQTRNRSDNVRLAHDGLTLCIRDWSNRTGLHFYTIRGRIRRGWSVERALTTPPIGKDKKPHDYP